MRVVVFGATGDLGRECTIQSLEAGHEVRALARTPNKLDPALAAQIQVVQGDALSAEDCDRVLAPGADAVLFAIGIDKHSPEHLCADATRHIFAAMRRHGVSRFVWCGGGSTLLPEDQLTFGSRFVEWFTVTFMGLRHRDKVAQLAFLEENKDLSWLGLRPLQMNPGPRRASYRMGFDRFSGFSKITFADCAHAMVGMLADDTWLHQAPIIQY